MVIISIDISLSNLLYII